MNLGRTIKHLRENARLTQQELADLSNFKSGTSISLFESGHAIPRFDAICKICTALNISTTEFYLLSHEPEDLYNLSIEKQKYIQGVVKRMNSRIISRSKQTV